MRRRSRRRRQRSLPPASVGGFSDLNAGRDVVDDDVDRSRRKSVPRRRASTSVSGDRDGVVRRRRRRRSRRTRHRTSRLHATRGLCRTRSTSNRFPPAACRSKLVPLFIFNERPSLFQLFVVIFNVHQFSFPSETSFQFG